MGLRRFLSSEEAARCEEVFAKQVDPSKPSSAAQVKDAIARPERWVLKPQREGGGNNIFDQELVGVLTSSLAAELAQYVLMERICAEPVPALFRRKDTLLQVDSDGELGFYTAYLAAAEAEGGHEVINSVSGAIIRSKPAESNEGGVCAGFGVLDMPLLVDGPHEQLSSKL